eukprot:scaffold10785_cov114-Isochrysis_galbana.AAC.7
MYNLRFDTRVPSHTPFGGVRNLANTYRRCGANWAPPSTIQLILPQLGATPRRGEELRSFETSAHKVRDLKMKRREEGGREWHIITCWRDR